MIENSEFLTAQEVADRLRVSIQTIIRELKSGELKGSKVGNQWRIRKSDILKYLSSDGEGKVG